MSTPVSSRPESTTDVTPGLTPHSNAALIWGVNPVNLTWHLCQVDQGAL